MRRGSHLLGHSVCERQLASVNEVLHLHGECQSRWYAPFVRSGHRGRPQDKGLKAKSRCVDGWLGGPRPRNGASQKQEQAAVPGELRIPCCSQVSEGVEGVEGGYRVPYPGIKKALSVPPRSSCSSMFSRPAPLRQTCNAKQLES